MNPSNTDYSNLLNQKRQELAVLNSRIDANNRRIAELVNSLGLTEASDLASALASLKSDLEAKLSSLDTELNDLLSKLPEDNGSVNQDF